MGKVMEDMTHPYSSLYLPSLLIMASLRLLTYVLRWQTW
jgi:hypothetical protein